MSSFRFAALVAALSAGGAATLTVTACSSSPPATSEDAGVADSTGAPACPADLPSTCPTPAPTWSGQVQGIVNTRCGKCHGDGGTQASDIFLGSYGAVYSERGSALSQVYGCRMPPATEPQPTLAEREALLGWFVCGAQNN